MASKPRQTHYRQLLTPILLADHLDSEAIRDLAAGQRRLLSYLTALTYDPDPTLSQRAIEAIGIAAARMAEDNPEYVRVHLRRQLWLLSDESGGIGWRAPEIIGEILYHHPQTFAEFVPLLISILELEAEDAVRFRSGTLAALGRLAQVTPLANLQRAVPLIRNCLEDADPQVRQIAQWCIQQGCFRSIENENPPV